MRTLDLSDNWLVLPLAQLLALPHLEHLSAGQRNVTKLQRGAFAGLQSLRSVDLSGSPLLESLAPGLLAGLPLLETICLSSLPRLTSLPVGLVLEGSRPLTLIARGSGLSWIDPGCLPWDRVQALDLTGNPLHCDCRLAWLVASLASLEHGLASIEHGQASIEHGQASGEHTAICASPPSLAGHHLRHLRPDQLRCVFLGPLQVAPLLHLHLLQVSMVSICLVVISLALGCFTFLIYRHRSGFLLTVLTCPPEDRGRWSLTSLLQGRLGIGLLFDT